MPIANVRDAVEVEKRLDDILDEDDAERRVRHIRTLFVETLDWQYADGLILWRRCTTLATRTYLLTLT